MISPAPRRSVTGMYVCHLLYIYLYKSPTLQLYLLQEIFLLLIVVAVRSLMFTLLICPHCHFHCNYIGSIWRRAFLNPDPLTLG